VQFDLFGPSDYKIFESSKIQYGGGRHFEKLENPHISATVSLITTKFRMVTQFGPLHYSHH